MKNVIVAGIAAIALVGCGSTAEDAGAVPVVDETVETVEAPAETGGVPVDVGAEPVAETVVE